MAIRKTPIVPTLVALSLALGASFAHADDSYAWLGTASDYAVLYDGSTSSDQLSISNDTIDGNIGVSGPAKVAFSGPGTIDGALSFSAANTGQYSSTNGSNVGPTSVTYNVGAVTTALDDALSLNSYLGGLSVGSAYDIAFTNSGASIDGGPTITTINESSGDLVYDAALGVSFEVFNVTGYSANNATALTINGNGSGDPVVFNFLSSDMDVNVNLGGSIALSGGLTPDDVLWNFTSSGKQVQLNNNGQTFQGDILGAADQYQSDSSNLNGRVLGFDDGNMQIVSGANINAPANGTPVPDSGSALVLLGLALALLGAAGRKLKSA